MNTVNLKINNIPVVAPEGATILEAAHLAGIRIPTLCYLKEINAIGACRICVCEVKGARGLVAACVYPVAEGMEILTNSKRVFASRKTNLELILSTHRTDCLSCTRSTDCELQQLCREYGVDMNRFTKKDQGYHTDASMPHLVRDNSKCILCRRCVAVCQKNQYAGVIETCERGYDTHIACAFDMPLSETACVACGQCLVSCPFGAIVDKGQIFQVIQSILKGDRVIAIVAPAFIGQFSGKVSPGKFVTAMKQLGFDRVMEVAIGADLCTIEEAKDFLEKVPEKQDYMATSCCPAWHSMIEKLFPGEMHKISMTLTPMVFTARMMKQADPDARMCFIGPCAAKKLEASRRTVRSDVDFVLTFEELAGIIEAKDLDLDNLEVDPAEMDLCYASAAGRGFAQSGGVAKAVADKIKEWRPDMEVKIASAQGLADCKKLLMLAKAGKYNGYLLEGMGCPGGCIGGAGTIADPVRTAAVLNKYVKDAEFTDPEQSAFMSNIHMLKDDPNFEV